MALRESALKSREMFEESHGVFHFALQQELWADMLAGIHFGPSRKYRVSKVGCWIHVQVAAQVGMLIVVTRLKDFAETERDVTCNYKPASAAAVLTATIHLLYVTDHHLS
jgi:hypothetical protein